VAESSEHAIPVEVFARFLRLEHAPGGPHELLGLARDVDEWTAKSISQALLSRLEMIDSHPQGRTPEADELRVALYVAAAQLRDPEARAALASEPEAEGVSSESRHDERPDPLEAPGAVEAGNLEAPAAVGMRTPQPVSADFTVAAQHVLASCGGIWLDRPQSMPKPFSRRWWRSRDRTRPLRFATNLRGMPVGMVKGSNRPMPQLRSPDRTTPIALWTGTRRIPGRVHG